MLELPTEPFTVIRVEWRAGTITPTERPNVLVLVPGRLSGVPAWEHVLGAWGPRALAEEISGFEILAEPV